MKATPCHAVFFRFIPWILLSCALPACSRQSGLPPGFEVASAVEARRAHESSSARTLNRIMTPDRTLSLPEPEPLLWGSGWCAQSQAILEQNETAIETQLLVEGMQIDPSYYASRDYGSNDPSSPTFCRSHYVLIDAWPDGPTCLEVRLIIVEPLSDGWEKYQPGVIAVPYCVHIGPK